MIRGLDNKALDDAYRAFAPMVFRRARALLRDESEAREIVQEMFLTMVDDPSGFRAATSLASWLYTATTHRCLNRLRDVKNRTRLLESEVAPPAAEAYSASAETIAVLRQVLAQLPEELAQVAVYFYMDEMTHEEIAEIVGCSRRHVANLLARLDDRMRREEAAR